MQKIKSNEDLKPYIENYGVCDIPDDIMICSDELDLTGLSLFCKDIYSKEYRRDIIAKSIHAWDINVRDIITNNISSLNISARDVRSEYINSKNIDTISIKSKVIRYSAACFAYNNIECESIKGSHKNSKHFCLDGKITIKEYK